MDVCEDTVLAVKRHFFIPDQVVIGKLPQPDKDSEIVWENLTTSDTVPGLENCMFKYLDLKAPQGDVSK